MFEEKERIFSRSNDGLYTIRSRSWLWLNKLERTFKRPIKLALGSMVLGIIFLMWGFGTLDALENPRLISGELVQCYPEKSNCIVLQIENERYSIEADENPQFDECKELFFQNVPVGDTVEIAVFKTVDGSSFIVGLMHDGIEYWKNVAIQDRYKAEANYMLIFGSMFVVLGLGAQIRKNIAKWSGES